MINWIYWKIMRRKSENYSSIIGLVVHERTEKFWNLIKKMMFTEIMISNRFMKIKRFVYGKKNSRIENTTSTLFLHLALSPVKVLKQILVTTKPLSHSHSN